MTLATLEHEDTRFRALFQEAIDKKERAEAGAR
jgi:hypothetical protein